MVEVDSDFLTDDLLRDVYCIIGIPVDAIGMQACLHRIAAAAVSRKPFLISTPNLNFVVNSQSDPEFKDSLLLSNLCLPDGVPVIWIARIIGAPIKNRLAGSDVFDALKANHYSARPLTVFLLGGSEGVAARACASLNAVPGGLHCVGSLNPGLGLVDELSKKEIIDRINSSNADILITSLGALKGQLWLRRNHHRLLVPVRTHLGAAMNFHAGTIRRAPPLLRRLGLEWLWRIKEEPYLWRRYWNDGCRLIQLLLTHILPLAILIRWLQLKYLFHNHRLDIIHSCCDSLVTIRLVGRATAPGIEKLIPVLRNSIGKNKNIKIDFCGTLTVDTRFLGLVLMLQKTLNQHSARLVLVDCSAVLKKIFRLSGFEPLLDSNVGASL